MVGTIPRFESRPHFLKRCTSVIAERIGKGRASSRSCISGSTLFVLALETLAIAIWFEREGKMKIEVLDTVASVAQRAAEVIAIEASDAVAARGRFVIGVSGGRTPWLMLRALANMEMPWSLVHVVQIDERVAPNGHPDRNLTHLRENLIDHTPLLAEHIYEMPVEDADLEAAAAQYASVLRRVAGAPPVLDIAHLGLGPDGHTASLVPGDPVLRVEGVDVAMTDAYQGTRRMTLTYPMINRSRRVLWVVTGGEKASMLARFLEGDPSIPSAKICREQALLIADDAAAKRLPIKDKQGT